MITGTGRRASLTRTHACPDLRILIGTNPAPEATEVQTPKATEGGCNLSLVGTQTDEVGSARKKVKIDSPSLNAKVYSLLIGIREFEIEKLHILLQKLIEKKEDINVIKEVLVKGCKRCQITPKIILNYPETPSITLLCASFIYNDINLTRYFLEQGASPNGKNANGENTIVFLNKLTNISHEIKLIIQKLLVDFRIITKKILIDNLIGLLTEANSPAPKELQRHVFQICNTLEKGCFVLGIEPKEILNCTTRSELPLIFMALEKPIDVTLCFILNGADLNIKDSTGQSFKDYLNLLHLRQKISDDNYRELSKFITPQEA